MSRVQQSDFDLSQFYAVFFEEAGENLESMEGKRAVKVRDEYLPVLPLAEVLALPRTRVRRRRS